MTGMRVSESAGLDVTDVDFNNQTFRVIRKGGNEAYIYFGDDVQDALCYYLGIQEEPENTNDEIKQLSPRESLLKDNDKEKALFLSLRGNRMAVRSIEVMVKNTVQ